MPLSGCLVCNTTLPQIQKLALIRRYQSLWQLQRHLHQQASKLSTTVILQTLDAVSEDFESRVWMTYRRGFAPLGMANCFKSAHKSINGILCQASMQAFLSTYMLQQMSGILSNQSDKSHPYPSKAVKKWLASNHTFLLHTHMSCQSLWLPKFITSILPTNDHTCHCSWDACECKT